MGRLTGLAPAYSDFTGRHLDYFDFKRHLVRVVGVEPTASWFQTTRITNNPLPWLEAPYRIELYSPLYKSGASPLNASEPGRSGKIRTLLHGFGSRVVPRTHSYIKSPSVRRGSRFGLFLYYCTIVISTITKPPVSRSD